MRTIESISHALAPYVEAMRPEREIRQRQAFSQAITEDGKLRGDRIDGFIPPHHLPDVERGFVDEINFGSIAAGAIGILTLTVPGAEENDGVVLGPPSTLEDGLVGWAGYVTATDEVTIRLYNATGGSINPALAQWRFVLVR